jgi:hypothetical protein
MLVCTVSANVIHELPQLKNCKFVVLFDCRFHIKCCMSSVLVLQLSSSPLEISFRRGLICYQGDQQLGLLDKTLLLRAQLSIKCSIVLLCVFMLIGVCDLPVFLVNVLGDSLKVGVSSLRFLFATGLSLLLPFITPSFSSG